MKRIWTLFEIILSAVLMASESIFYMLYEGISNKSAPEAAILIGGAVCVTLSATTLISAGKSILWHRRMRRHSMAKHGLDNSAPEHNHV